LKSQPYHNNDSLPHSDDRLCYHCLQAAGMRSYKINCGDLLAIGLKWWPHYRAVCQFAWSSL